MKAFQYKSLTKNWPGGRRKSLVIECCPFEGTFLTWNKSVQEIPIQPSPIKKTENN